jgi:fructose-1,6-bisphosphatase II
LAAYDWVGRGDKNAADGAAVEVMRKELNNLPIHGTVVIGEGAKDEAPELYCGEAIGVERNRAKFDIAVDPVEGTSYTAKGLAHALAVIALAPRGTMFDPGPSFYMDKIAVPKEAKGKIAPDMPTAEKLRVLAHELGKDVRDLNVFLLEKPRHEKIIQEIYAAGARCSLYPAGDVMGALLAAFPEADVDMLLGTGGTPEGILSACALRALGADFMGSLNPQSEEEAKVVAEFGLKAGEWLMLDELVSSNQVFFCATGITDGVLVDGVSVEDNFARTQTLMISGPYGERQVLTSYHMVESA